MADFNLRRLLNGKTAWTVDSQFARCGVPLPNSSVKPTDEVRIRLDVAKLDRGIRMMGLRKDQDFLLDTSRGETLVTYELAMSLGLRAAGPTTLMPILGALIQCHRGEIIVRFGETWRKTKCFFPAIGVPDMQNRLGMAAILDKYIIGISIREVTVFRPGETESSASIAWLSKILTKQK